MNTLPYDDAQERAKIDNLIEELPTRRAFGYACFNDIYKICVERKQRRILGAIKEMDTSHAYCLSDPRTAEEARMRRMMLYTCYIYFGKDNAYLCKTFAEFLKHRMTRMQKMNNNDECCRIHAYLEGLYKHSSYQEYQALTESHERLWVYQRHLWNAFFRHSETYLDVIPCRTPSVLYTDSDAYIPRFIFESPYVSEFSKQDFYTKFAEEWKITHYCPVYDGLHINPVYLGEYLSELTDNYEKAYRDYQNAVTLFKKMSGAESQDDKNIKMEGQKWK